MWCAAFSLPKGVSFVVTETVIETPVLTDPEPQVIQTEEPVTEPVAEPAAEEPEAAAVPQVEVTETKPDYLTREEWEKDKATVRQQAADEALENDRRRRQTENARKAQQEKRDAEMRAESIDVARATLGLTPEYTSDEMIDKAITRAARKQAESLTAGSLDAVEQAWDYITAPAYGKDVDLEDGAEAAARRLMPKVQHLIAQIRPAIEKAAREGYVLESELPKRYEDMDAARAAKGREGKEELARVEGTPAPNSNSLEAWETRVAHQGEDGYPYLGEAEWASYRHIRTAHGLT